MHFSQLTEATILKHQKNNNPILFCPITRRQVAKEAFEKEQQVRKLVDEKKADLAITQLLEHNEELER